MKKISVFILSFFVFTCVFAQKANFEQAEKFSVQNMRDWVGDLGVQGNWLNDVDRFWYSFKTADGKKFSLVDAENGTREPLFDTEYMASELTKLTDEPYNAKDLPITNIEFKDDNVTMKFEVDDIEFTYNIDTRELVKGEEVEEEERERWKNYSPDSTWIVFAKDHDLYLMEADDPDSVEIRLTEDGERWFSFAADAGAEENDERVRAAARWFNDSEKLYVNRRDSREVEELWVIDVLEEPRPTLETYKYPMPGEENVPQDSLSIFDVETKERVDVDASKYVDQALGGAYFGYGGGFFMGDSSDKLYFIRRDRTWSKIDLCVVDTETGEVTELLHEVSKPYFNTRYARLAVIEDGEDLIWFSERDSWGHLYRYDSEGNLKNRITEGNFNVGNISQIDTLNRQIYFQGFGREKDVNPYYPMYYRVDFDGSNLTLLTPEDASHTFNISESSKYFVDNISRVDEVPRSVLRDNDGELVMELEKADISRLEEAGWKMPEPFTVKAADGVTDIYGVMWKPFDFDPDKEYPIITHVYPGPQTEPTPTRFSLGQNVPLAQTGFVVVAVGQRGGHPVRSKHYHTFGYGNLRDYALEDNKYALEQLADRHSYIDIDRVGIYGHSGGGFMSTAAILSYPDFYKAAVSSAGNHDNNIYNMWWSEVHHGVKEITKEVKEEEEEEVEEEHESIGDDEEEKEEEKETKTVFESQIPTNQELAENLEGHLLLVTGDIDNNVHPGGTLRVAEALIKANKRFDMMIFPGMRHGFGGYSEYFRRMKRYYFAEHLLGEYRNNVEMDDF